MLQNAYHMKKTFIPILALIVALMIPATVEARKTKEKQPGSKGYVTGSVESTSHLYQHDSKNMAVVPEKGYGTNNYVKLEYLNKGFTAGLQAEAYYPALLGYSADLKGVNLTNLFLNWKNDSFSVTAGSYYEQFGSGLLFRSWEDRAIGLNNSMLGARVSYSYKNIVSVKALWGLPRAGMTFSKTHVAGGDVSLVLSEMLGMQDTYLALEGSVMDRYEALNNYMVIDGCNPNRLGWSARANLESDGFFLKAEYVDAGQKYYYNTSYAGEGQIYHRKRGNAQLVETGYNGKGLGVNLSLRRLEWMDSKVVTDGVSNVNMLNYVPALCTQYTYMLTTLHPYGARTGDISPGYTNSGEIGGQFDVFYNVKRGTKLGGKRGMKLHANFSTYYAIAQESTVKAGNLLFRDMSIDVEKQWTRKFKSVFLWSMQEYSKSYGAADDAYMSNIFVADLLYKFTPSLSARLELQYLLSEGAEKDWMAALLEVNFAPHWSIFASDMYNHGSTKVHYYNGGVSWAMSRIRLSLGYGRYRAGMICSGGVCRQTPAYTGGNFALNLTF